MTDDLRRLAAAQAELAAAGLNEPPNPIGAVLMRALGQVPRPWPYLPLGVRMAAYAVPYTLIWVVLNFLMLWRGREVEIGQAVVSTIMVVSLFTMLMLGYELRRWSAVRLSRWEDL